MAAKKGSKKKTAKLTRSAAKKKGIAARKVEDKKQAAKKTTSKSGARKKLGLKKSTSPSGTLPKKAVAKTAQLPKKRPPQRSTAGKRDPFASQGITTQAAGQSGDLQGLSDIENADSESVDELVEEGNAFEADAVMGVESADNGEEVRTHEVPEDDVPEEYLDKD